MVMPYRRLFKPLYRIIVMGLKQFIRRLIPRGYVSLDQKGVSRLLKNIDSYRGGDLFLLFSFFKYDDWGLGR